MRFLGEITGETTTEDMLTRIFSTFVSESKTNWKIVVDLSVSGAYRFALSSCVMSLHVIRSQRVVTPSGVRSAAVHFENGKILAVSEMDRRYRRSEFKSIWAISL
jgi:hypothetical protein